MSTVQKGEQPNATQARRFIRPLPSDDWNSIAARELSDQPLEDASKALQSWNFHVFMRITPQTESGGVGNPILPSDIIFLEPPAAPAG